MEKGDGAVVGFISCFALLCIVLLCVIAYRQNKADITNYYDIYCASGLGPTANIQGVTDVYRDKGTVNFTFPDGTLGSYTPLPPAICFINKKENLNGIKPVPERNQPVVPVQPPLERSS